MAKKELAKSFLNMVIEGDIRKAYEKYIAPDLIHHNAYFKGDRETLRRAMEDAHKEQPHKKFEIKRIFEDGDFVITHSSLKFNPEDKSVYSVIHIFKFRGNQVVEFWDVGQEISDDSPNENGSF